MFMIEDGGINSMSDAYDLVRISIQIEIIVIVIRHHHHISSTNIYTKRKCDGGWVKRGGVRDGNKDVQSNDKNKIKCKQIHMLCGSRNITAIVVKSQEWKT